MNEKEKKAQSLRLIIADSEAWMDDTKFKDQVEKFITTHLDLAKEKFVRGGFSQSPSADFEMGGVKKLQDLLDAIQKAPERKSKALEELKRYE